MKTIREISHTPFATRSMLALACLIAIPWMARAEDGNDFSAAAAEQKPIDLEPMTVTVTAQKESAPALSTPRSITAVTEEDLVDLDIQTVKSAAAFAPNTFINEFTARAVSNPFFRGIGGSPINPGVSTIIDGVPQLHGYSSNIELIDVRQIEFVRGPEAALYGRNTAGGLIHIASRVPGDVWTARGQADFGNYNRRDVRGSVSGPLLRNRFALSVAGGYSARDGYTVNDSTAADLDFREAGAAKVQLLYKAADRFQLRFILSGEHDRDGDYGLGDLDYIRLHPHHVSRDFSGFNRRSIGSATLAADYHGRMLDISSITGGVWWKNHGLTDLDYRVGTYGIFATRDNVETQHQFTQEFRFSSPRDQPLNLGNALRLSWQAGIFVFNQGYQQDATNYISGTYSFFPGSIGTSSAELGDSGMGIYGAARFTAWKHLSFTAGVRFDYESKTAALRPSAGIPTNPNDSYSEASPQFGISYRLAQDHMAYISVTRGYKAGGFNASPIGIPILADRQSYEPEHTWNYELGYKARWLDGRMETTAALFYIDWQNLQLNQQFPYSGGQYFIGNAGKADSKGLEVEARYHPYRWWELFGMVGYTHARFLNGSSAFNANWGMDQEIGGNSLPYTPTFNANMGTQVSWAPRRHARLFIRVQLTRYGDFLYDATNAMGQASYHLVNLRGGVRARHWFAEGWADNAFNAHYVPVAIPYAQLGAPSGYIGESGAPATYGIRLGFIF